MSEPGKAEILKWVWAASTVSTLCMSQEALQCSIDVLCAHLDMYDLDVWSILHKQDTCVASVKELEELTDKEVEMRKEKAQYDMKWAMTVKENVGLETGVGVEEEEDMGESKGESKSDEEEDEPIHGPGLLVKVQGKCPAK